MHPLRCSLILLYFCLSANDTKAQDLRYLPALFRDNLIQIFARISDTDTLWFYTDTGGLNFIYKSGIKKLGASPNGDNLWDKLDMDSIFMENHIPVSGKKTIQYIPERNENTDGMLGREWFYGGIWLIDYEHQKFGILASSPASTVEHDRQKIPLYFRKENSIIPSLALPRIEVIIDSDTLSFLLDTGAQVHLSDDARKLLHSDSPIATSFIVESVYNKWKNLHPEWQIIPEADASSRNASPMIRVPDVRIGIKDVGPVYFTVRADPNFQRLSELYMDQPVQGAIGGNCLSLFKQIIIDYSSEHLEFAD